jgi:NADH-quinone oxidoreductase subunit N
VPISYMQALAPELVVTVFAIGCLILAMFRSERSAVLAKSLALAGLLAGLVVTLRQPAGAGQAGEVYVDSFAMYVRATLCGVGAIVVLSAWSLPAIGRIPEMFALLMFSVVGAMLVPASNDLVLLFFALELVSVPTYVMVAAGSNRQASQEAGLKYFFLGALSSAVMVYGFSFLYGAAGTTTLLGGLDGVNVAAGVRSRLADNPAAWLGLVLALLGLAYKVAAVPMHFYVADVYQGAAAPISAMLSFVPKFAGLVAMMKILALVGWPLHGTLYWLVWGMAAATMTVGNALALLQDNVKRMLGYSSIAHSGYMLIGLLVGPALAGNAGWWQDGLAGVLFYIVAYGIMNIGAFTLLAYLGDEQGHEPQMLQMLSGLGRQRPGAALALALCVFSLLGIPPTAGFFGKVYLFGSALALAQGYSRSYMFWTTALVVLALLNTAVSSGYYLRIVGAAYIRPAEGTIFRKGSAPVGVALALCAALVLVIGLRSGRLEGHAVQASQAIAAGQERVYPVTPTTTVSAAGLGQTR